jgi:hypothetical protein
VLIGKLVHALDAEVGRLRTLGDNGGYATHKLPCKIRI